MLLYVCFNAGWAPATYCLLPVPTSDHLAVRKALVHCPYYLQGCTALSVVSMPFYWPPRAGTM